MSKDDCLPFNIDTSSQVSDNAACPVCAGERVKVRWGGSFGLPECEWWGCVDCEWSTEPQ